METTSLVFILELGTLVIVGLLLWRFWNFEQEKNREENEFERKSEAVLQELKDSSKEARELLGTVKNEARVFQESLDQLKKQLYQKTEEYVVRLNEQIELFKKGVSDQNERLKSDLDRALEKLNAFQNKLELVKDDAFSTTAGRGLLGEAIVRESMNIVFGKEAKNIIWFDPKSDEPELELFKKELREIKINPDFFIKLNGDGEIPNWLVIDAKTYLPSGKYERMIWEFVNEGKMGDNNGKKNNTVENKKVADKEIRKAIDNWINQVKNAAKDLLNKKYLDRQEGRLTLWIVVPESLLRFYVQKYNTVYVQDSRITLVSLSNIPWLLSELKARNLTEFKTEFINHHLIEWAEKLRKSVAIANEIQQSYSNLSEKIKNSLETLNLAYEEISSEEFRQNLEEFSNIVNEINKKLEAVENTTYSPKAKRGYNYTPN